MAKSKKSAKEKDLKSLKEPKTGKEKKAAKEKAPKVEKKPASKKTEPKAAAAIPTPKKTAKPARTAEAEVVITFTTEEISLRAYYIAERRQAMGWPGDSTHDWVEAERQLKAEAKKKAR